MVDRIHADGDAEAWTIVAMRGGLVAPLNRMLLGRSTAGVIVGPTVTTMARMCDHLVAEGNDGSDRTPLSRTRIRVLPSRLVGEMNEESGGECVRDRLAPDGEVHPGAMDSLVRLVEELEPLYDDTEPVSVRLLGARDAAGPPAGARQWDEHKCGCCPFRAVCRPQGMPLDEPAPVRWTSERSR